MDSERKLGSLLLPFLSPSGTNLCFQEELGASVEVFYGFRYHIDVKERKITVL